MTNEDAINFFEACKQKIDNKAKWIKDADAKDWKGRVIYEKSDDAIKFSVLGVMGNISSKMNINDVYSLLKIFQEANNISMISMWQQSDELVYEIVIEAFERAIEYLKKEKKNVV